METVVSRYTVTEGYRAGETGVMVKLGSVMYATNEPFPTVQLRFPDGEKFLYLTTQIKVA